MIPRSFDLVTCRELLGDARARVIEQAARVLADAGEPLPTAPYVALSYWGMVQEDAADVIARSTHQKRQERNARKERAS